MRNLSISYKFRSTQLSSFAYRGFRHAPDYGDDLFPHFIRETV